MKIIPLIQGSDDWKSYRRTKVMASDACTIMGTTKFKTIDSLLEEKLMGDEQFQTEAMKRGSDEEPLIRDEVNLICRSNYQPVVVEHDEFSWLAASLDGYDHNFPVRILEIKRPSKSCTLDDLIKSYYPQLQQQMFVCGESCLEFACKIDDCLYTRNVRFDPSYWEKYIVKASEFYKRVQRVDLPDVRHSREFDIILEGLASEYSLMGRLIEGIEEKREIVKNSILEKLQGKEAIIGRLKITKVIKKGAVDYSKIEELKSVDLDKYRKPETQFWKISNA